METNKNAEIERVVVHRVVLAFPEQKYAAVVSVQFAGAGIVVFVGLACSPRRAALRSVMRRVLHDLEYLYPLRRWSVVMYRKRDAAAVVEQMNRRFMRRGYGEW